MKSLAVRLIDFYQRHIRVFLPPCCRFWPSCSEYYKQAIIKYGIIKGGLKGTGRLLRCHPLNKNAGYDPLL
ncbi:MAG: membrane protein insertion efficiency factor YidD [Candidatus Omnitrophica bacterium]|nr:membrane protein insertion efficiency factor YidD [Candidatus Omnitrophota bacterium]MDD5565737.1 membrane protein insertion efficiency factor YidD [Candidatus Omnitrophota bacterium]